MPAPRPSSVRVDAENWPIRNANPNMTHRYAPPAIAGDAGWCFRWTASTLSGALEGVVDHAQPVLRLLIVGGPLLVEIGQRLLGKHLLFALAFID